MKKTNLICLAAISQILAVCLGVLACNGSETKVKPGETSGPEYTAQTETGQIFQNLLDLTVNAVIDSAEKTLEYDSSIKNSYLPVLHNKR